MKKMKKLVIQFLMLVVIGLSFTTVSCSNDDEVLQSEISTSNTDESLNRTFGPNLPDTYMIKKYVFNRSTAVNGLGHVGVAFELRARISGVNYTSFYCGAIENEKGSPIVFSGGNNGGWWSQLSTQPQMLTAFRNRGYNRYKFGQSFVSITLARSNQGKAILAGFPNRGYNLSGNNCMNAAYDVLSNFSFAGDAGNPSVPGQYFPNNWYNALTVNNGWSNSVNL